MKPIVQPFILLLGLCIALVSLWFNWASGTAFRLPGTLGVDYYSIKGHGIFPENFAFIPPLFYVVAIVATLIVSDKRVPRTIVLKVFEGLFYSNILLIVSFLIIIMNNYSSKDYYSNNGFGFALWIIGNLTVMLFLWKFPHDLPLQTTDDSLLDDLPESFVDK